VKQVYTHLYVYKYVCLYVCVIVCVMLLSWSHYFGFRARQDLRSPPAYLSSTKRHAIILLSTGTWTLLFSISLRHSILTSLSLTLRILPSLRRWQIRDTGMSEEKNVSQRLFKDFQWSVGKLFQNSCPSGWIAR
jgi:hypothetical protein